jgi:hypothetical protein
MASNLENISNDIINYVIFKYLSYFDIINLKHSNKYFNYINLDFFHNKCNIIKSFIRNKMYNSFIDLKGLNRNGYLIKFKNMNRNINRYNNKLIQFICPYEYSYTFVSTGNIVEGKLIQLQNAWVLYDDYTKKIHPFIKPFIIEKSIRIIKP